MDSLLACSGINDGSYVHGIDCAYTDGWQVADK
jgi:hypothetical protein